MSAYGGGNLLAIILAGSLPRPCPAVLSIFLVALLVSFGVGIGAFALISSTPIAFADLFSMGLGNGYLGITLITFLQQYMPVTMLGRMMSLLLFANVAMMPLSQVLSGLVLRSNLASLFIGTGVLMLVLAVWSAFQKETRTLGESMASA